MEDGVGSDAVKDAMAQLWLSVRDLYIATLQFGDIGTELDLQTFLDTGNRLGAAQRRLLVATLNEGFRATGNPHRL